VAYTFDNLGYAKRLRDGGVPQEQAEAHAEAARDFIMAELATKADVLAVRTDLLATEQRLQTELRHTKQELQTDLRHTEQKLQSSIDSQTLRLTVRLGTLVMVGIGALAAVLKLT
jgi:hypothetical protein